MKRILTSWRHYLALSAFSALSVTGALAEEPLPYFEQAAEEEVTAEPLFDASPVAYDSLQPADGMESMGMGMASPAPTTRSPTARRVGPTGSRQANIRLASVPNMFGDFGMSMGRLNTRDPGGGQNVSFGSFDIPSAGGSRRVKIGENNVALPSDRVYVMYNHFHNVFEVNEQPVVPPGPAFQSQTHIDRYTVGAEKMFFDDLWSVEVRMPFNSSFDYQGNALGVDGGNIGNLSVILKNLLYIDENTSVAGGVAFDTPTGSDVDVRLGNLLLNFKNDAFHILPWIGFANNFNDAFYVTGFAQLDLATNGNEIVARQLANRSVGFFNEQNLAYLDLSVGTWVYRDPDARRLTSIALQGELHYTTTIQDSDLINTTIGGTQFDLANPFNRQDIVNGTIALQFEIANASTFRVAAVSPLSNEVDRRVFDSELQVQFNRRF